MGRADACGQVHIVIEVGKMPFISGRVGEHTSGGAVEEVQFAAHNFKHHLLAVRLGDAPMHSAGARVDVGDAYLSDCRFQLVDGGKLAQNPRHQLQVNHCTGVVLGLISLIFAAAGEIEQPCRESSLVEPFNHKFGLLHSQPHESIASCECHAFHLAARHHRLHFVAARHYGIFAFEVVASPFDGARRHRFTTKGVQRDACAGIGVGHSAKPCHSRDCHNVDDCFVHLF